VGSLADALVAAVNDPVDRARRAAAARQAAEERYSWPALADRLADTLDEIVAGAALTA
jgi:glycosyltransferase involved in cell wall biosynthesis